MTEADRAEGSPIERLPQWGRWSVMAVAAGIGLFHLFAAGVAPFTALVQRPVHFGAMAVLGFLGVGIRRGRRRWRWDWIVTAVLIAATVSATAYLALEQETLVRRSGSSTALDLIMGAAALVIVLELARRATGWGLVVVAGMALTYAFAGPYLPGFLAHRGYGLVRILEHLYLSTEGIWGVPLGVSADFVYLFILFGATLEIAGGGQLLIGLASAVAGRSRGGPAKTAALASAIMGSLSGSAVANVVTTGSLTIPLMKRTGFKPFFAGAIEAAASTGGQLMPPIMGAGAFILATWTNIPYGRVALAAAVPAILYYAALFMAVHFRAAKRGLAVEGQVDRASVVRRLHLLAPLLIIVVLLALGRSPMRAAFWGVVTAAATTAIRAETRLRWAQIGDVLVRAATGTVQVAAACAAAGVVVGIASLTGIGLRMSDLVVTLSGGYLPVALVLTALGSIVLGMGLPTTAAYVVLAALGAPALVELEVPTLSAHLYIFYFGCLSNVTPPVSLAAYAGAGIAGAPPLRTAVTAMGLAAAGFIVPVLFVYDPALLLVGSVGQVVLSTVTAGAGVTALAAAGVGYFAGPLTLGGRALTAAAAIGLMSPGWIWDAAGAALLALAWAGGKRMNREIEHV